MVPQRQGFKLMASPTDSAPEGEQQWKPLGYHGNVSRRCILVSAIVLVMACSLGFLLGWLLSSGLSSSGVADDSSRNRSSKLGLDYSRDLDPAVPELLMKEVKAERIEHNLRWLTSENRIAGTEMDLKQALILKQIWLNYGLDNAGVESFSALLSYPGNHTDPNRVEVIDPDGRIIFHSRDTEKAVPVYEDPDGVTLPYFAYSRPGIIEGDLIYANYGNDSDYEYLWNTYSLNVTGKIVLTRSGITSRFSKVDIAVKYGVAGLLIFPDMAFNAPEGRSATYPATWWLPGDATERGSMYGMNGDPLTPGYPARDYTAGRTPEEIEQHVLTPIPVQPVSADGAIALLSHLSEDTPTGPDHWFDWQHGWVPSTQQLNFVGGKQRNGRKVRLIVNNRLEKRLIHNAFGIVKGVIEPDRFVMIGNHRDAWGRGAVDPGGGTATMLEISRAVGVLIKKHEWRPRRTIIFASWGAEEFGLIGSTEWVEEKLTVLNYKAVAYLNLDVVVTARGPAVAKASSNLFETIFKVSTKVPHPKFRTLYDSWANQSIGLWPLHPNSDFAPFFYLAGVPSLSVTCTQYESLYPFYPTYHTEYDVFDYVKNHVDPTFEYHQLIGRLYGHITLLLADSLILPMDPTPGAVQLEKEFAYLQSHFTRYNWFQTVEAQGILEHLDHCIHNFSVDARHLREKLGDLDRSNPYLVRKMNDQLMLSERAFINLRWKLDKDETLFHHVLKSPGTSRCMDVDRFPGIRDFLCDPELQHPLQQQSLPLAALQRIKHEVGAICYALHSATDMMNV